MRSMLFVRPASSRGTRTSSCAIRPGAKSIADGDVRAPRRRRTLGGARTSSSAFQVWHNVHHRRDARTPRWAEPRRRGPNSGVEDPAERWGEPLAHALVAGRVRMQVVRQIVGIRFAEQAQSIHVMQIAVPRSASRFNGLGDDFADPRQREAADPVRLEPVDGDELPRRRSALSAPGGSPRSDSRWGKWRRWARRACLPGSCPGSRAGPGRRHARASSPCSPR